MRPVGPDDDAIGYEQARRLLATTVAADIDRGALWLHYFGIGGEVGEFEVDAYLHHSLALPRLQRDLLAQAANELLADHVPPRAPYAADIQPGRHSPTGSCTPPEDPGAAAAGDGDGIHHDDPGPVEE